MIKNNYLIKIPSEITKVTTMSNGAIRLVVDSQENIHPEDKARIMDLHEKLGVFVFAEARQMKDEDLLNLPEVKMEPNDKSPSQKLRNRMYVYYHETHTGEDKFYEWYSDQMEKLGQHYLWKLQ